MSLCKALTLTLATALVAGCFPESGSDREAPDTTMLQLDNRILDAGRVGAIAATSPDYSTSDIVLFSNDSSGELEVASGEFESTSETDIAIAAFEDRLYRLGRFQIDNITKYQIFTTLGADITWQYSVQGDDASANPYDVIFASDSKAYVPRYDSPNLWVIDPSKTGSGQAGFKQDQLDLSSYATYDCSGGTPNANGGVVADGRLYILMERLGAKNPDDSCNGFAAERNSYVAVFDVATGEEVDTATGTLKGVELSVKNAGNLSAHDGLIYVSGRETGKIETIDPDDGYATEVIIDDAAYAGANHVTVVDANHGYFVSGAWPSYTLYHFNPSDLNQSITAVDGPSGENIADIEPVTLADPDASYSSLLYVAVQTGTQGRIDVVNVLDQSVLESFELTFFPTDIEFLEQ